MRKVRQILRVFISLTTFFVVIFLLWNFLALFWMQGGKLIVQPSPEIQLTAEYLYLNPLPTPSQIETISLEQEYLCIITYTRIIPGDNLYTRWFLNGERVPHERYDFFRFGTDYCLITYQVLPGIHLVEIQVNGSPFYTAMSYKFAIKIEPTPTPSPTPPKP